MGKFLLQATTYSTSLNHRSGWGADIIWPIEDLPHLTQFEMLVHIQNILSPGDVLIHCNAIYKFTSYFSRHIVLLPCNICVSGF